MLIKFEFPFADVKPEFKSELEAIAISRQATIGSSLKSDMLTDKEVLSLKEEKVELEQRLKDAKEESKMLTVDLDTANKSIYDKERMVKQTTRDITHLENVLRNNKTKLQEMFEQLNKKEIELKNSEKEIDNLNMDIKKNEIRFDKQK